MTAQPTDQTTDVGLGATFTAAATGFPAPTVKWQQDTGGGFTDLSNGTIGGVTYLKAPAAFGLTHYVQAQLYGMTPNDPLTVALAVGGIAGVATMAGFFPARRATRIDPMRALRWE